MIETTSHPDNDPKPYAGRQVIFTRLQQHILDPIDRHAIILTGHQGMGKSATLRHAHRLFDDPILTIYIPLAESQFKTKDDFLQALVDGINQLLEDHQFSLSRVPQIEPETDIATWLQDTYLPDIMSIIRKHRYIVWLLDDVQYLLELEPDILKYLHNLLEAQSQFAIVCTLSTEYEGKLPLLQPLINPVKAERIHRLNHEDSATLIRRYASSASDDIVTEIFSATGGHPQLLTYYGETLQKYWADHEDSSAFNLAKPDVYSKSQADFRQIWLRLSRDERLVLTALASLIYSNPLQLITPKHIEQWLIETDYLMDIVAINAALRGLDYQDIVSQQQNEGVRLTMGLIQQWLLEKARLEDDSTQVTRGQLPMWVIVLGIVLILIIIVLVITIPPLYLDNSSVIPTATLAS